MKQAPALRQTLVRRPSFWAMVAAEPQALTHDSVTALEPKRALGYAGAVTGSSVTVAMSCD